MASTVVAIFLISLFVEAFSAPSRCADCQTWESHSGSQTQRELSRQTNRDDLSHRSGNLEDLTQQAEFELNRSHNHLTFDNTRPGNWTDVNHYGTSDGHGRVYEEQGQRVDGPTRIRYMRKNFTSSYSSGGLGSFGESNLGRIYPYVSQDASQSSNREALDQTQNSAYDQFAIRRNSHNTQNSLHSTERVNSRNDASRYYETRGSSGRLRETSSDQSAQQRLNMLDQTRPGNWSTVNTYRTDGGNGRVYEERRQIVTGPRQVVSYRRNYTSSYSSGGDIPTFGAGSDETRNIESNVQQQQRQFDSLGREIHEGTGGSINGGYTRYYSGHHTRPSETTSQTNYRYVSRPSSYEPLDSNSHQTYQHTTSFGNQHGSQSRSSSASETGQVNERIPISGGSSSTYVSSSSYNTRRTPEISTVEQSGTLPGSEAQTRQIAYGRHSDADYIRISGSQDLGQRGISSGNLNNQQESYYTGSHGTQIPLGQIRHYDQFQTSSTSGSSSASSMSHPDMDVTTIQSGSNRGTQHRFNTHNSLDQTVNVNYDRSNGIQSGHLVTQGLDLGQISQVPDCAEGTDGHSSYEQSYSHRVYRGTTEPQHLTQQVEDLTQQSEDLTQQTEDLTQQTQDLTQQTQDLTQQTEDLTQQSQHSSQRPSSRPGKLDVGSQQVEDLTQQTQDLTQQTEDLTQQTEDLTQQTQDFGQQTFSKPGKLEVGSQQVHDLTQQTQDLTQQTEDFTQQSQDFSQRPSSRPGKLEVGSQQVEDLTQQTQDLTQQTEDLTQQTEDLTQQPQDFRQQTLSKPGELEVGSQQFQDLSQQTQDLTQQTEDFTQQSQDFGQRPSSRPGKLEVGSQQVEDLTQQTQDLTQQTEDLTQQTQDLTQQTEDLTQQTQDFGQQTFSKPGKLEVGSQQVHDLTQQTQDLTQQTEDFTQQSQDFGQRPSSRPGRLEVGSQQVEDLTQQTQDLTQQTENLSQQTADLPQQGQDFGHQSSWTQGQLEVGSQQVEDLTQQTQDLSQQTVEGMQQDYSPLWNHERWQTDNPNHAPLPIEPEEIVRPQYSGIANQQSKDLTQQTDDLTQQTEDLGEQTEDLTQQTEDLGQQTEDLTQQTEDLGQQTEDLTQQSEDLSQQGIIPADPPLWHHETSLTVGPDYEPPILSSSSIHQEAEPPKTSDITSQQTQDLGQQTVDLGQENEDLTQQTVDLGQENEDLTQQTVDLGQENEDLTQQTVDLGQENEDLTQQTVDLGQENDDLTQQTVDLGQENEDLTQQTVDLGQEHEDLTQQTVDLGQENEDLTQQTVDLGQKNEDLTQQTVDLGRENEDLTQQTVDLGQENEDLTQQTVDLGQENEDLTQQTQGTDDYLQISQSSWRPGQVEVGSQRTEDLTQKTQGFGQETVGQIQGTESVDYNRGQITSDRGFGQQTSWNYQNLDNAGQQIETFNQENQFGGQQTIIPPGQATGRAPKPAPKPRRPRPTNSHHTQEINIEMEEPTVSDPESHRWQHNDQENNEKWVSTNVPSTSQRGDQGINANSNESGEAHIQIESEIPKVPEHQVEYVLTYPDSFDQETTRQNQFRQTQFTKTKTSRRGGHPGAQYQGPQGWHSPRDSQVSQEPTMILIDRHQLGQGNSGHSSFQQSTSTGQVTEDLQQHLTSIEEGDQLESVQRVQIIQPVGAGIESRQAQSSQSDRIVFPDSPKLSFEPRILEAFGAKGPYGDHDLDIFDSAKPNSDPVVLIPPEEGSDWDIREVDTRVTTTTEIPTIPPATTTSSTTTTTTTTTPLPPSPPAPPPTPTPAPGFWKKFGNTLVSTVDKARDKARDWFG